MPFRTEIRETGLLLTDISVDKYKKFVIWSSWWQTGNIALQKKSLNNI